MKVEDDAEEELSSMLDRARKLKTTTEQPVVTMDRHDMDMIDGNEGKPLNAAQRVR